MPKKKPLKKRSSTSKKPFALRELLLSVVLAVGIVFGIWALWQWFSIGGLKVYRNDHMAFKYSRDYVERPSILGDNKKMEAKIKLSATKPLRTMELNKEIGASIAATFTRAPLLDMLEKNAARALPARYPDYKQLSAERFKVKDQDASLIRFSYTAQDKKTTLYTSLFLVPIGNDAYYLTLQSADQSKLNKETRVIQETLEIY